MLKRFLLILVCGLVVGSNASAGLLEKWKNYNANYKYMQQFEADRKAEEVRRNGPEKFEEVYTDRFNNLVWGRTLLREYFNGCTGIKFHFSEEKCTVEDVNGQPMSYYETKTKPNMVKVNIEDGSRLVFEGHSEAAGACRSLNARLPTKAEFESLIRNFEHHESPKGPYLVGDGLEQWKQIFGYDILKLYGGYWTSTADNSLTDLAYVFAALSVRNNPKYDQNRAHMTLSSRVQRHSVSCVVNRDSK